MNRRTITIHALYFAFIMLLGATSSVFAFSAPQGIENVALDKSLGSGTDKAYGGSIFSHYIIVIWRAMIVVGGLAVLLNFISGALNWITAGGDQGKIKHAREQITNAVIGLIILSFSFIIITYVMKLFGLDVLNFSFPTPA